MTDDEQMKEQAAICIQSYIRGYLERLHSRQLKRKPLTYETAAIIIQKSYRGFHFRKTFQIYKQRLNIQMLCFIQQIELISNDFFTKIVRTNYCVPLKSIESTTTNSHNNHKQSNKLFQHLFPPPPPLPLPSTCEIFSPLLSRHSDSSNPARLPINTSSIPVPPPLPSALSFPLRSSPSRHQLILTSSSPTSSGSKFAQVRDIFARAETASTPVITHHSIPIKNPILSIEQTSNSKSVTVLNAVQEYQRQHINIHQPVSKRFIQLGNNPISNVNRSPNIGGLRSRGIGHINFNNNNKLQNKQNLPAYVTSSPQQQSKSITRVI